MQRWLDVCFFGERIESGFVVRDPQIQKILFRQSGPSRDLIVMEMKNSEPPYSPACGLGEYLENSARPGLRLPRPRHGTSLHDSWEECTAPICTINFLVLPAVVVYGAGSAD
jgi:hypothetical protein